MNDKQKLIALIALSEQTFEENYYAWYRVIFRRLRLVGLTVAPIFGIIKVRSKNNGV